MINKVQTKIINLSSKSFRYFFSKFIVNNPTTGQPCAQFPTFDGEPEMKKQEIIMNEGRAKWNQLNLPQRKLKIQQFVNAFEINKQNLIEIIQSSTGRHRKAAQLEVEMSLSVLKQDLSQKYPQINKKQSGIYYLKAFGNILIVCDYRMVSLSCVKYLVSCGIAGNCLIFNPHRYGLPIAKRIQAIWRSVLPEYPILYCPINNFADGLEYLVQKKDMGFVSFTGDIQSGNSFYHFMAQKSQILAQSEFLLTSSDSAYVLKDLNDQQLEKAAKNLAIASFMAGGNLFNSVKRIYVDQQIRDKFIDLFASAAKQYNINVPDTKVSPIITSGHIQQAKTLINQLKQYKQTDMKLLTQFQTKESYKSLYVSPIIYKVQGISSIEYWNKIYPLPICFIEDVSSNQSAIEHINSSIYGNTATIYSTDKKKIYQIGEQLDVGAVNGKSWGFVPGIPYSPRKRSGKGHSFSVHSFTNVVKSQALKGFHIQ